MDILLFLADAWVALMILGGVLFIIFETLFAIIKLLDLIIGFFIRDKPSEPVEHQ